MSAHRVVVVGHGMAGVRVVEEIRARADRSRVALTVLGAEPHAAYNRVLLPEILAGRHTPEAVRLTAPDWARRHAVDLRLSAPATSIDPARRMVRAADGADHSYDSLVLATGSQPWLPPVAGLADRDGRLTPGAVTFHTLDDCLTAMEAGDSARRTVVLGGGVLGLEIACALAGRGAAVEVVHDAGHLMDRQLDPPAGQVLSHALSRLGVRVRAGSRAASVQTGHEGRVRALTLADGARVEADLLIVACGVRPRVGLAAQAGLAVRQGILVDDALRSASHPEIYAIGECAEHEGRVYGLVAPAWEQAAVAAARVTGSDPVARYTGSRTVTRLKAAGVSLAAMGETAHADEDGDVCEVVSFSDLARGAYHKLVIRDDRVAGAIMLGDVGQVGAITQLYDRAAPAPSDRLSLLFGPRAGGGAGGAGDPASLAATAIVCRCNGVSKSTIQSCVLAGARSAAAVAEATRAATGCGACRPDVIGLVEWLSAAYPAEGSAVGDVAAAAAPAAAAPAADVAALAGAAAPADVTAINDVAAINAKEGARA